jgi:hypothetical protein
MSIELWHNLVDKVKWDEIWVHDLAFESKNYKT